MPHAGTAGPSPGVRVGRRGVCEHPAGSRESRVPASVMRALGVVPGDDVVAWVQADAPDEVAVAVAGDDVPADTIRLSPVGEHSGGYPRTAVPVGVLDELDAAVGDDVRYYTPDGERICAEAVPGGDA